MNNREIVDYILSNKLQPQQVIKETYNNDYEEGCTYIYYDGYNIWNDNGDLSILYFQDDKEDKSTYEVITRIEALKEIENRERDKRIKQLEQELAELKKEK